MTEKQRKWYLREWSKAFRAHWSGVRRGEVVVRPGRAPADPVRDDVVRVAQARRLRQGGGGLSADDLRRACHILAVGKDVSSWALTNKQLDRVVALFRRLAGLNLGAVLVGVEADAEAARRQQVGGLPDADRKRVLYSLERVELPPQYVEELSRDKFGTGNWRSLPGPQLYQLLITAKARSVARAVADRAKVNLQTTL
ncbi:MAG: hypothetical protein KF833_18485 [Verrucomicrobiae bacterium]|nr:hypothetical protein [Verrucomicrobiae bacterium]